MSWLPWNRPRHPLAAEYLERNRRRRRSALEVADETVIVLDAETSGFEITDRLLSLATIEIHQREIAVGSLRQWLIYQPDAKWNEAVHVHGILPSETAEGKPEAEVIRELLPILDGHLLVGHHIAFDVGMLSRAAKRHLGVKLKNRVVDTAVLAMQELTAFHRTGYPNQRPPSLDEVCTHLGIEMVERHTASGDTFTTAEVFLLLCARLRRRLGRPVQFRDLPMVKV